MSDQQLDDDYRWREEQQKMDDESELWKRLEIYQLVRASGCLGHGEMLRDLRSFLNLSGSDIGEKT